MATHKGLPLLPFKTKAAWATWLRKNHAKAEDGIWLKFAKKASGLPSITYAEAREVAIVYGWIDGLKNALDDEYYTLRFTPRRPKSKWSKINRGIAEALIKTGKMKAAGLKEVEAAKKDGRWKAAYASQAQIKVPTDLTKALARVPKAKRFFAALDAKNRYAILFQIEDAKKPETRARRIKKFVQMCREGVKPYDA